MACFLAPTAEAVIMTVVSHHAKKKEQQLALPKTENAETAQTVQTDDGKIPFSRKLSWLTSLLWGGSFLLLFEHIWHGEVVPWPPFLTAMATKADTIEMLKEIATTGVTMALLCTAIWCGMLIVAKHIETKRAKALEA